MAQGDLLAGAKERRITGLYMLRRLMQYNTTCRKSLLYNDLGVFFGQKSEKCQVNVKSEAENGISCIQETYKGPERAGCT
jgi:hypothetical protein